MSSPRLTRRAFLRRSAGTASALSAAAALAPHLLPARAAKDGAALKVGILHSLTGVVAIPEASLKDAELLAIEEINAKGGVLGKKVEAVVVDPESKFVDVFPDKAKELIQAKVACIFGCWTSVSRKMILPVVEENNALLFYPAVYEGNECSKNVVYSGAVPNQQVLPAVDYFWAEKKRKFYLLGSDYVFPRFAFKIAAAHLKDKYKADPVNEKYVPLGYRDFANIVADIKKSAPDVILSALNGDSNVTFFKELSAAGVTPAVAPVCNLLVDEDDLRGLGDETVGHFTAATYFQSIDSARNKDFVKGLKAKYGKERVSTDTVEAAYSQVYLWKAAVEKAQSVDVDKVREALRDLEWEAPRGKVKVDGKNRNTWKRFRLGKITKERQFEVVYESKESIRPEPYPAVAFPGWDCDWSKGGVIRPKQ